MRRIKVELTEAQVETAKYCLAASRRAKTARLGSTWRDEIMAAIGIGLEIMAEQAYEADQGMEDDE